MWPFRKRGAAGPRIDETHGDPAARALVEAVTIGDWRLVRDIFEPVADSDDRAALMRLAGRVEGVPGWIGEWRAAEPSSTLPLLFLGCHSASSAWELFEVVPTAAELGKQERKREFRRRLLLAENALDDVVARDADDVTARTWLVMTGRGRGVDVVEARLRFNEVVKRHPGHVLAHEEMLQYLCPTWFGDSEQLFAFAREAAASASPGSLVHTVVALAHLEHCVSLRDPKPMETAEVRAELLAAAENSVLHPSFTPRFGWQSRGNAFAMAFAWAELHDAAARVFDLLGDQPTESPWYYRNERDPAGVFAHNRQRTYSKRSS